MPNGLSAKIERLRVSVFTVPTDAPESDGTFEWDHTTMVLVEADAAGQTGIGYTYADASSATLIEKSLKQVVEGLPARCDRCLGRDGAPYPQSWPTGGLLH